MIISPTESIHRVDLGGNAEIHCSGFFGNLSAGCLQSNGGLCSVTWMKIPVTDGQEGDAVTIGDNSSDRVYAILDPYEIA